MQTEFGEFRYLFKRSFVDSSRENSIDSSAHALIWTDDCPKLIHETKLEYHPSAKKPKSSTPEKKSYGLRA